jgi:hypothetical protein
MNILGKYGKEATPKYVNPNIFQEWRRMRNNPILRRSKSSKVKLATSK